MQLRIINMRSGVRMMTTDSAADYAVGKSVYPLKKNRFQERTGLFSRTQGMAVVRDDGFRLFSGRWNWRHKSLNPSYDW